MPTGLRNPPFSNYRLGAMVSFPRLTELGPNPYDDEPVDQSKHGRACVHYSPVQRMLAKV
jgi:hypothetical protein